MPCLPTSTCGNRSLHEIVPWHDQPGVDAFEGCIDNLTSPCRLGLLLGACRCVWNRMLAQQMEMYDLARMEGAKPRVPAFFTLGKALTRLRSATPWLETMPYAPVRYTLKYQADAWKRFGERRSAGRTRGAAGPSRWPAQHSDQHARRIRFRWPDNGPCDVEIVDDHRGRKA